MHLQIIEVLLHGLHVQKRHQNTLATWYWRKNQNTIGDVVSAKWAKYIGDMVSAKIQIVATVKKKIDLEVLGLSLFPSPDIDNWMEANPEQQVVTTMQVHQGDQPRLPPSCIASLACVCMMAACPLHKQKTNKRRSFTSLQMSHTHTLPKQGFIFGRI